MSNENSEQITPQMSMLRKVQASIPAPALLESLAEEAVELAQASLKYARLLRGENPTPADKIDLIRNITEEVGDVMLCLDACELRPDNNLVFAKLERWVQRLEALEPQDDGDPSEEVEQVD